jgi:thiamine biosynthesis lipoprotein
MRAAIAATIVTFATSILTGCGGPSRPAPHLVERARPAMGSELRLTAWTADEGAALAAFDAVFAEFERLDALMSVWRPGSDVLRLNAAAGDRPVALQPDVIDVLTIARQVSEWTDGTFAVTFGALADLWRFDHDQDNTIPDPAVVRQRLPLADYRGSRLTRARGPRFSDGKACGCTWAGSAKGTRWIARSRCFDREV